VTAVEDRIRQALHDIAEETTVSPDVRVRGLQELMSRLGSSRRRTGRRIGIVAVVAGVALLLGVVGLGDLGRDRGDSGHTESQLAATRVLSGQLTEFSRELSNADLVAQGASTAGPPQGLPTGPIKLGLTRGSLHLFSARFELDKVNLVSSLPGRVLDNENWSVGQQPPTQLCPAGSGPGRYRVDYAGARLTIQLVRDRCVNRKALLIGSWQQRA
jgi:hypothetical protein